MGGIIYWGIIRTGLLILSLWILYDYIEYKIWFVIGITTIYGVIIHPAVIQYQMFRDKNRKIIEGTLCSTCKHFDETAILCLKYDEHPKEDYVPCDAVDWEPK
ncbi:MAG: hypothetical protein K9J12_16920 [Melioribacteraceae bacterium]|nr:hypothetical protein [Melioribacteraceae bacterium]MCF8263420.1 hypothetical protein [Melioribacteraceae bacterium]MCF8414254.1 hypothetical protein [Melioribacteraceae bacterium]MCF8430418.1 hypothetical protein [Melioribacteraceae bacterium]